ncbi:MAG: winged helix-turn-helix domain-containing protein [Actinobacteria bacterium]|nr:winged helix-turn-helix domain-containing protein [Actinomycetota bacterium]
MEQTTQIEVGILGPLQVTVNGRPADVSGPRRTMLLAVLALHQGRVVSVDALIDAVWGLDDCVSSRNALHHHVVRLRAALGRTALVAFPNGYALVAAPTDAAVCEESLGAARRALRDGDAELAEELAGKALSVWRGAALQGLTDTPWLQAEAHRLEELRIDALEERFEAALVLGRHREVVSELELAIAENPFRERLWRQLMIALYRSGRQAEALDTFRTARNVYVEELGLEPSPELRRVQEAILAHDPALAGGEVGGRRDELARLVQQLRADLRRAEELYARAVSGADDRVLAGAMA